jgi:endonuclease/exonuclease/phosphatase family metal-dependent hydrolase
MDDRRPPTVLILATFNVHLGVDGWGRPYDVVGACRALGADVLLMQESWAPDGGDVSTATTVADRLGMEVVVEVDLAHGRLFAPVATAGPRWGPRAGQLHKAFRLDGERLGRGAHDRPSVHGTWGLALLSRLPMREVTVHPLGQLRRDAARRVVVEGTVGLDAGDVTVCGTHMSHITHGSHTQYRRLAAELPAGTKAAVLAGDMNLWGPPVSSYLRGWRRAVKGKTWPAHRPHSQLDHVLTTPPVTVVDARIGKFAGSDHRPVVVTLTVGAPTPGPHLRPPAGPDAAQSARDSVSP